jgi:hypothetical protein
MPYGYNVYYYNDKVTADVELGIYEKLAYLVFKKGLQEAGKKQ